MIQKLVQKGENFEQGPWSAYVPYIWQLYSSISFSCMSLIVKKLKYISPARLLAYRAVVSLPFSYQLMRELRISIYLKEKNIQNTLILRGLLGAISLVCWYTGLRLLLLSEAITLYLMTPFYTAFLGYFVLGEKIGRVEVFCAFSAFAGILLITKPTFVLSLLGREVQYNSNEEELQFMMRMIGFCCCFVTSFSRSCVHVIFRFTKGKASALLLFHYFVIFTAIFPPTFEFVSDEQQILPDNFFDIGLLFLMSVFGFTAQIFSARSFQLKASASKVSIMSYIQLVISFIFDIFLLGNSPDSLSVVGTLIISTALLSMIYLSGRVQ